MQSVVRYAPTVATKLWIRLQPMQTANTEKYPRAKKRITPRRGPA